MDFLLGEEGQVVRDLVTDELAKGIDAGWRLATDNVLQDARVRLTSILQVFQKWTQLTMCWSQKYWPCNYILGLPPYYKHASLLISILLSIRDS